MLSAKDRVSLVRALVGLFVLALVMLLDPMGLDAAADRHSADVVSRMTALFYGRPEHKARDRIAVVQISDRGLEQADEPWPPGRTYYARLLKRLTGGEKKPAVVFFDYAFVSHAAAEDRQLFLDAIGQVTRYDAWKANPDCQASALSKMRCITWAGGVPVMVGKIYPPNACLTELNRFKEDRDDPALFHVAVVVPLGWEDLETVFYPMFSRDQYRQVVDGAGGFDLIAGCHDLKAPGPPKAEAGSEGAPYWAPLGYMIDRPEPSRSAVPGFGYDLTPATAMAYAVCLRETPETGRRLDRPWSDDRRGELCRRLHLARAYSVYPDFGGVAFAGPEWGSIPDRETELLQARLDNPVRREAACEAERATLGRALAVGWAQFTSGLGEKEAVVAVPCPYHLTLDAADVLLAGDRLDAIREAVAGRAVAIGAAQALSNDWISTTLQSRRAGVHYHAMLLDNLLERGVDIRRKPPVIVPLLDLDAGDLLELFCAFLVLLLIERVRYVVQHGTDEEDGPRLPRILTRPRDANDPPDPPRWLPALRERYRRYWAKTREDRWRIAMVARTLAAAALVLVVATIVTVLCNWEPLNIVGLLSLTLLAVAWELWTHRGWAAVIGLAMGILLLAPLPAGRAMRRWFGAP